MLVANILFGFSLCLLLLAWALHYLILKEAKHPPRRVSSGAVGLGCFVILFYLFSAGLLIASGVTMLVLWLNG